MKKGLVIYFAAERVESIERRLAAFRKKPEVEDIPLAVISGRLDMTTNLADVRMLLEEIDALEKACGLPCIWIIVDTLSRTFGGGDQNASKDMGRYVQSVDEIRYRSKAHVTAIHHSTHTANRGKGAIDLDGAIDASFFCNKAAKGFLLVCDGANDSQEAKSSGSTSSPSS